MSKDTLLKLDFGLSEEVKFLNLLRLHLKDTNIKSSKTTNNFCCVDFDIVNEDNNKKIVLELKSRTIDLNKKPSFLIACKKLYKIKMEYENNFCLLIWSDIYKNVFYLIYNDELLKSPHSVICGQDCFFIDKNKCFSGVDGLITTIKTLLNY